MVEEALDVLEGGSSDCRFVVGRESDVTVAVLSLVIETDVDSNIMLMARNRDDAVNKAIPIQVKTRVQYDSIVVELVLRLRGDETLISWTTDSGTGNERAADGSCSSIDACRSSSVGSKHHGVQ